MKKLLILIFFITLNIFLYSQDSGHSITVKVTGIEKNIGKILMAVYNSKESYPQEDKVYMASKVDADSNTVQYTFENIPDGTYGIAIFHDENNNGIIDKGLFGIPKEGYAFSNNVFGTFSSPQFEKISFVVERNTIKEIKIKY